jgi:glycosyltransferase involved in cell wall biosynthesis
VDAARKRVADKFSWEKMTESYWSAYERVVGQSSP